MKLKKLQINILLLLLLLNSVYFVKSSTVNQNNNQIISDNDNDLINFDNTWKHILDYEQNIFRMEEKLKSMSEIFDQLEIKMASLMNSNMDLLEKHIRKVMEETTQEKIAKIDKIMEEKSKEVTKESLIINQKIEDKIRNVDKIMEDKIDFIKKHYNLNEIKCFYDNMPKTCYHAKRCNNSNSTVYNIMVPKASNKPFPAACDFETLGGDWIIIQRRQNGSENFYRNWTDYVEGFGDVNGEFFIGLKKLHALTSSGDPQELYIILENFDGVKKYARYGQFKIDSESTSYKLTVGQYSGDAGDALSYHSGKKFSTWDRDNDLAVKNCAEYWKGAWWYNNCFNSNLNGQYYRGEKIKTKGGINWYTFGGAASSLKATQMMIRKRD